MRFTISVWTDLSRSGVGVSQCSLVGVTQCSFMDVTVIVKISEYSKIPHYIYKQYT